jgi:uncharacterized protein (DUF362 family)/Pyruvate/2-oxoacid:ferredoxin oxidoreductase delta subunit
MKVALLKCESYDLHVVKEKIRESLNLIDGFDQIKKDAKVFIKLNCVGPFNKDQAITTHPVFVQAVIQLVKEKTHNIIIGDNPATKELLLTLKTNGIYNVIVEENVQIVNGKEPITIKNPNPKIYNSFNVSKEMIEVDVMINLPKLKTHALAYMTVAQKNLFGLIYGLSKAGWHVKASNPLQFGEAINDLYGAILNTFKDKTIIHICDGIMGLEGEGPGSSGIPKASNVILASNDAISLDRVAVELVHLDHKKLFINNIGTERGLGVGDLKDIEIVGNKLSDFEDLYFLAPLDSLGIAGLKLLKIKGFRNLILEHPKIDLKKCIKCGECAHICPPKAMTIEPKRYPKVKASTCIRCWCCSEVCPKEAISKSRRPLIGRIALKNRD